jgi:hypothetical protein
MKQQLNLRTIAVATGGGAALILVAAQLIAKPNPPVPLGRAVSRTGSAASPAGTRLASTLTENSPLVGTPTVRELFRPLISDQPAKKPTVVAPPVTAPKLPPASGARPPSPPASSSTPPTSVGAVTPPMSSGDIHMLGVVEIGTEVKALLKKSSTGESRYFAKGEDAFGFTVGEIKVDNVTLAREGRTETVAMSKDIPVETSSGTSVAASSGFRPGGGFGAGGFGGGGFGGGGSRERGDRNGRGGGDRSSRGSESGRSGGAFSTSEIMSLPTWTERLKKLNEVQAQLDPAQYDRLKKFMEARVAAEKGK